MKAKDVLNAVLSRVGMTKREIAKVTNVSDVVVGKAFKAQNVGLETASRYLSALGYKLYAVPESIHIDRLFDDAIEIEPDPKEAERPE